MSEEFEVTGELVGKIEEVLGRGLCLGQGDPSRQMCVEAAVCFAMGLPHGDNPPCVGGAVRSFKMTLNDSMWSSNLARAGGMRKVAIAQLGSNTLGQTEFAQRLADKTIRTLIPTLFREVLKDKEACLRAADLCETSDNALTAIAAADRAVRNAVRNAYAAYDTRAAADATASAYAARAVYDARAAATAAAASAAYAARVATDAATLEGDVTAGDKYLMLSAELCFQVLDEMNSPGAVWMRENNWQ